MLHLKTATDPAWVSTALGDLDAVLVDHAHCELKAAANALAMAARHPDDPVLVGALSDLAREEIDHFQRVHARLVARGVALGYPPADPYVAALRRALSGAGRSPVDAKVAAAVDRLLVCALIEARSCERFTLLAEALSGRDAELAGFYQELRSSEARHYRVFIDLAVRVACDEAKVLARLDALARAEAGVVSRLLDGGQVSATIHG